MGFVLTALSPDVAESQWPALRGLIDEAMAVGGEIMPEDFAERVGRGDVLVWTVIDEGTAEVVSAVTTELTRRREGLVCWVGQCAGRGAKDWIGLIAQIEDYARAEGCVKVASKCREGWRRLLKDYRVRTITIEKALS